MRMASYVGVVILGMRGSAPANLRTTSLVDSIRNKPVTRLLRCFFLPQASPQAHFPPPLAVVLALPLCWPVATGTFPISTRPGGDIRLLGSFLQVSDIRIKRRGERGDVSSRLSLGEDVLF
ncbi:hypothetical protein DFH94DRAFT_1646 [Russula ochroleuca]|uniref:Uncharacterized protein n=1 Tax=Russula ochroleuca TaxID=152965 RepID=A0A9P5TDJ1_9AGAM|nr:hypothetical protein DFH94DRAFT_1646 [Russula ochroleuca]